MSGGQEKNFSTLGPKLRGSKAQQYYGDKQRQIRIEVIDYIATLITLSSGQDEDLTPPGTPHLVSPEHCHIVP